MQLSIYQLHHPNEGSQNVLKFPRLQDAFHFLTSRVSQQAMCNHNNSPAGVDINPIFAFLFVEL